jgi:hypothetical protein
VLSFPIKPNGKMTLDRVNEIIQTNLLPVIAWRLVADKLEPLTIAPLADDATHYLIQPGGKIFQLADPSKRWANGEQFAQHLLQTWRSSVNLPSVDPPRSGFVAMVG